MVAKSGKRTFSMAKGPRTHLTIGKYTWIERSFEERKPVEKSAAKEEVIIPDSKLEPAIQVFHFSPLNVDLRLTYNAIDLLHHDFLYRVCDFWLSTTGMSLTTLQPHESRPELHELRR